MARLYKKFDGVKCRGCGSSFAQPSKDGRVCQVCINKIKYMYQGQKITDEVINLFLSRQLELTMERIKIYGFANKCECFTKQNVNQNAGFQCPRFATTIYNGRHVCAVHNRALLTQKKKEREGKAEKNDLYPANRKADFIENIKDPYWFITETIKSLSEYDEDFKECVRKALSC